MNGPGPVPDVVTGAAMDTCLVRPRWRRLRIGVLVGVALVSFAWLLWQLLPHGLSVSAADLRIGTVERSIFHDDVSVLASARPLRSVVLDSIEQGRVEEVFVQDGALVKKGQLLFRLSNTQRLLELVARQSDRGLNVANLSSLRLQVQTTRADHDRRMLDLEFALAAAKRQLERDTALARQGFIAPSVLDASRDLAAKAQRAVREELTSNASAEKITKQSLEQMDQAMATIDSGLGLLANAVRALAVRAPVDGRLTDFHLEEGETVSNGQHLGRIDDPSAVKLTAELDEFYLNRVTAGTPGRVMVEGRSRDVKVSLVNPQIKSGRFVVELVFSGQTRTVLRPGQSVELQLILGEATPALSVASGPFLRDGGGNWCYVLNRDGSRAERRVIRIGRRNSKQVEILEGLVPGERVIVSAYTAFGDAKQLQLTR